MGARVKGVLENPRFPILAALLCGVLALPAFWMGFQFDDYGHRFLSLHPEALPWLDSPNELFTLAKGSPGQVSQLIEAGVAPWWTNPRLRLSFWRPLSSFLHRLEYRLWPDNPVPMHAVLISLLILLTALAGTLYRRILGPAWPAGLATLFYAVDDGHASAAGWIASHNTFLVAIFGFGCLLFFDRWRKEGNVSSLIVSVALWLLALLSNEGAVAVLGFLFAYVLFLDQAGPWRKGIALLPFFLVFLGWMKIRADLGHGVQGTGFYCDPVSDPIAFLKQVGMHAPILLYGQLGLPSPNLFALLSKSMTHVFLGTSLAGLTWLWWVIGKDLFSTPEARFFGFSMMFSLLPISATIPADRLLFFVGFSAFGLMVIFFRTCIESMVWTRRSVKDAARAVTAAVLLFVHGPMSFGSFPVATVGMGTVGSGAMAQYDEVFRLPEAQCRRIMILNGPSGFFTGYAGGVAASKGISLPPCFHLFPGIVSSEIERRDAKTLVVRLPEGLLHDPGTWKNGETPLHFNYMVQLFNVVYRAPEIAFSPGETVTLPDLRIRVVTVNDRGMPTELEFRFQESLDHPSQKWFAWKDGKLRPFIPPPIGARIALPGIELPLFAGVSR